MACVWLVPRSLYPQVVLATHGVALGVGVFAAVHVFAHRRSLQRVERWVYVAGAALALLLGSRDFVFAVGGSYAGAPALPVAFSLAIAAFGTSLLLRYAGAVQEVGRLNASLEARVHQRETELARNFERLRELEHREVLTRERERIMRDLHDGLGGRLVSALGRVEGRGGHDDPETAEVLRDALAEMRMVIDSLDPALADLPSMLAHVRERVEPSLEAAGIHLRWAIEDVPEDLDLGPDGLLDVLRIVQESITNVVRHAGARTVTLAVRSGGEAEGALEVVVADDGVGLGGDASGGRGVPNMRRRAEALGGSLQLEGHELPGRG